MKNQRNAIYAVCAVIFFTLPFIGLKYNNFHWPSLDIAYAPGETRSITPVTSHQIVILVDSLRYVQATDESLMPFLNRLKETGAYGVARAEFPTITPTGYLSIFCGIVERPIPGLPGGYFIPHKSDSVLKRVTEAGMKCYITGSDTTHNIFDGHYTDGYFIPFKGLGDTGSDEKFLDYAEHIIQSGKPWNLISIDLLTLDKIGHKEGALTGRYLSKLRWIDSRIEHLWHIVPPDTTFLIASQHGSNSHGEHYAAQTDMTDTFFCFAGRGILRHAGLKIRLIDLAPTLAALLGVYPPLLNEGSPAIEIMDVSVKHQSEIYISNLKQRGQLLKILTRALKKKDPFSVNIVNRAQKLLLEGSYTEAVKLSGAYLSASGGMLNDLNKNGVINFFAWAVAIFLLFFCIHLTLVEQPVDSVFSRYMVLLLLTFSACLAISAFLDIVKIRLDYLAFAAAFGLIWIFAGTENLWRKTIPTALLPWIAGVLGIYWIIFTMPAIAEVPLALGLTVLLARELSAGRRANARSIAGAGFCLTVSWLFGSEELHNVHSWMRSFLSSGFLAASVADVAGISLIAYILRLFGTRTISALTKYVFIAVLLAFLSSRVAVNYQSNWYITLCSVWIVLCALAVVCFVREHPQNLAVFQIVLLSFFRCFCSNQEFIILVCCVLFVWIVVGILEDSVIEDRFAGKVLPATLIVYVMLYGFMRMGNSLTFGGINISYGFLGIRGRYNLFWIVGVLVFKQCIPMIMMVSALFRKGTFYSSAFAVSIYILLSTVAMRFFALQYVGGPRPLLGYDPLAANAICDQLSFLGVITLLLCAAFGVNKYLINRTAAHFSKDNAAIL
jgi:hypothetical protein